MIEVIVYSRPDCHLCDEVFQNLREIDKEIPLSIKELDIDQNSTLSKKYALDIPVVVVGPYTLKAPIEKVDLEVTIRAAQQRQNDLNSIDEEIASGRIAINATWNRADRITSWLTRNWLAFFNLFVMVYVGLPFLAPLLMKNEITGPANLIYKSYSFVCHQFAFRSWFLFGEQLVYPREEAQIQGLENYQSATGMDGEDLWSARDYVGNSELGYKVALCQRDVAIYLGILLFGLLFGLTKRRLTGIPWYIWILLGILPIGIDGFSQLVSQPPLSLISYRESTPLLRVVTGFLFGFVTAWFGYPIAEESMRESQEYLDYKKNFIDQSIEKEEDAI